jgi:beta-glucanase (GH16 family)
VKSYDQLVWQDDFSRDGSPDPEKWNYDIGRGPNGWGNNEAQEYTESRENSRIENGRLIIEAAQGDDGVYRSARLNTYGKSSWTHGSIEFRAKLPRGRGTWPAIWMLSDSIRTGTPWPRCGEIDLLEHIGRQQDVIHFSLHSEANNHTKRNQFTSVHPFHGVSDRFNTYRVNWSDKGFSFLVNGEIYAQQAKGDMTGPAQWPFDQNFHLIVNLAVGGYWGGEIDDAAFPARLELEYIRVYQ